LQEIDEGAWIFSGYYFSLFFLENDRRSPDWKHPDALDHPPLAKYLFGWIAYENGYPITSISLKEWWNRYDLNLPLRVPFVIHLRMKIPLSVLWWARFTTMFFLWGSALLIFFIGFRSMSPMTGTIAAFLFAASPLTATVATLATADALFLFLLLAVVAAGVSVLSDPPSRPAHLVGLSLVFGFLCALHFNTKINGILSLATAILTCFFASVPLLSPRSTKVIVVGAMLLTLITTSFLSTVLLNPSLSDTPLETVSAMFSRRWERIAVQQQIFSGEALITVSDRMVTGLKRVLFDADPLWATIKCPLFLLALIAAIWLAVTATVKKRYSPPSPLVSLTLFSGFLWIFSTILNYHLDWQRYLLPTLPFVALFSARSLVVAVHTFRDWQYYRVTKR